MVKRNQAGRQPQDYSSDSDSKSSFFNERSNESSLADEVYQGPKMIRVRNQLKVYSSKQRLDDLEKHLGRFKRIKGWVKNQRAKNRKQWVVNKLAQINKKRL